MNKILEKTKCSGCSSCALSCPNHCITMICDEEGFFYPAIDESACIDCELCKKSCPILMPKMDKSDIGNIEAYGAITKDKDLLLNSSSGGIFGELATYVIEQRGIVFGAMFVEDFSVEHGYIDKKEDLKKLQGSKYVQSKIGNSYAQVKKFLEEGRLVYFSGTPCQIEGLYSYLKKEYDNLITQDLICHGVPSPMVWKNYLSFRKGEKNIKQISFRDKSISWKTYSLKICFEKEEYCKTLKEDLYIKSFLKNLSLRPSCYNCSFKTVNRIADITLADFWGIEKVCPEIFTKEGVSLVLLHSEKGKSLFTKISAKVDAKKVDLQKGIEGNSSISSSVACPKNRIAFFKDINKKGFAISKKYCDESFVKKVFNLFRRVKNRIFKRKK